MIIANILHMFWVSLWTIIGLLLEIWIVGRVLWMQWNNDMLVQERS